MNRGLLLSNIVAAIVGVSALAYLTLAALAQGFSSASGRGPLTQLTTGWVLMVPAVSILSIILSRFMKDTSPWIWALIPVIAGIALFGRIQFLSTQHSNQFKLAVQQDVQNDELRLSRIGLQKLFILKESAYYEQFLSFDNELQIFVHVIRSRPGLSFDAFGKKNGAAIEVYDPEIFRQNLPFKDYLDHSGKSIHDYYELKLSKEPKIYLDQIKKYQ